MEPFRIHTGIVAPMDRENVDTDAIIPKQFLKSIKRTGFGENLFDAWRFLDPGVPGADPATRRANPDRLIDFRNCFGMIASVSTFSRSIGATSPLCTRKGSIVVLLAPPVRPAAAHPRNALRWPLRPPLPG